MPKATDSSKVIHTPLPVSHDDVNVAIDNHIQILKATGDHPSRIRLDYVLTNYVDDATLEGVISDAVNDFIAEQVERAYEDAYADMEVYFE